MAYGFLFAMLSPFFFGLMNVYDKYAVERKIKHYEGYAVMNGIACFSIAAIFAAFLDWSTLKASDLIVPMIAGLIWGGITWLYYIVLSKEDISHAIGLNYVYPIIVAFLGYLILDEKLHPIGYLGMFLTITGAVLLSGRLRLKSRTIIGYIAALIFFTAVAEFFVKIVTNTVPLWNGLAISGMCTGIVMASGVFLPAIYKKTRAEMHNFHIAFMGISLYYVAASCLYFAMSELTASLVSGLAATQPLYVVILENLITRKVGRIAHDKEFLPKLGAVTLIVGGVVLIYLTELF